MEKSIIYLWAEDNLKEIPERVGVFLLRSTPVNGDIVLIRESSNLKNDISVIFKTGDLSDVKYFDWYVTDNLNEAGELKTELKRKYHLEA